MIRTLLALLLLSSPALAQHNHERGHNDYRDWSSRKTQFCCNTIDCGSLRSDEVMQGKSGPMVLIAGQWCPVLPIHYVIKGRSPDWNTAHACISRNTATSPCERLLCYMGQGGF